MKDILKDLIFFSYLNKIEKKEQELKPETS